MTKPHTLKKKLPYLNAAQKEDQPYLNKNPVFTKPLAPDLLPQTILIACKRKALSENYLFFIYCAMKRLTALTIGSLFEGVHPTSIVLFLLMRGL